MNVADPAVPFRSQVAMKAIKEAYVAKDYPKALTLAKEAIKAAAAKGTKDVRTRSARTPIATAALALTRS